MKCPAHLGLSNSATAAVVSDMCQPASVAGCTCMLLELHSHLNTSICLPGSACHVPRHGVTLLIQPGPSQLPQPQCSALLLESQPERPQGFEQAAHQQMSSQPENYERGLLAPLGCARLLMPITAALAMLGCRDPSPGPSCNFRPALYIR